MPATRSWSRSSPTATPTTPSCSATTADLSAAEADAQALVTTLQVQRAMTERGTRATIVAELLDRAATWPSPLDAAANFIVSDRLISLLLTQVAENPSLVEVFEDLLSPEGSELYCKPAARYVTAEAADDVRRAGVQGRPIGGSRRSATGGGSVRPTRARTPASASCSTRRRPRRSPSAPTTSSS